MMVGSYGRRMLMTGRGVPFPIALVASMAVCVLSAWSSSAWYKPWRGAAHLLAITAIGVSYLLQNSAQLIFFRQSVAPSRPVLSVPPLSIGGVSVSFVTLLTSLVDLLMVG